MDLKSGLIEINGEIFTPGYTFENFQKSTFFEGDGGQGIPRRCLRGQRHSDQSFQDQPAEGLYQKRPPGADEP